LPDLIKDIVDVLVDQKDANDRQVYATKSDLKTALGYKLDADVF
jgi:hypothetical protein